MKAQQNIKIAQNFDLMKLTQIYEDAEVISAEKNIRDLRECKKYVLQRIFPLKATNGKRSVALFEDNKLQIVSREVFDDENLNRFPCKELKTWFNTSPEIIYFKLSCSKNEYIVDFEKKKIYNFPTIRAKYSAYDAFDESTKKATHKMLNHMKNINCGGDDIQFQYLLKIIKNMCNGIKNNICVLIRGIAQGTGKSTFTKFLETHVIGRDSICVGTSNMVIKGFNYPMYAKIMVKFEELPCFSREQYKGVSGTFKTWITEDYINYEDKGKSSFDSENVHTMFILSNNDCIEDDDGRRFFILDISNAMKQNEEYFKDIYSKCFSDKVGDCFYSYLQDKIEIPEGFDPSAQMPMTKNKKASIAQKLEKPLLFIKDNYVLKNKGITKKIKELFEEYNQCGKYFPMTATRFHEHLKAVDLAKYISPVGGYPKLRISMEELNDMYIKNHWIGELDEYEGGKRIIINDDEEDNDDAELFKEREENKKLRNEIEELKAKLAEFENKLLQTHNEEFDNVSQKSENKKIIKSKKKEKEIVSDFEKEENYDDFNIYASVEDDDEELTAEAPKKKSDNKSKKSKKPAKSHLKPSDDDVCETIDNFDDLF